MLYRGLMLAVLGAAPPMAQAPPAQRITFDDAIQLALKQNASVRQAQNAATVATDAVAQARQDFLPDLRLNASGSEAALHNHRRARYRLGRPANLRSRDGGGVWCAPSGASRLSAKRA